MPSQTPEPPTQHPAQRPAQRLTIDRKMLDMLVCPVTKTVLHYDQERQELVSYAAKVAYPIRDSIPIMLIEEARDLSDAELARHKGK